MSENGKVFSNRRNVAIFSQLNGRLLVMRILITFTIYFLIVFHLNSQNIVTENASYKSNDFYLSASFGVSVLGPLDDIKSQMESSGFSTYPPGLITQTYPIFSIEGIYYFTRKTGISINYGRLSSGKVEGYNGSVGKFLTLESEIKSASINYIYTSKNKVHNLIIGPAIMIHNVRNVSSSTDLTETENIIFGVNLGYLFKIVNKKKWFLALKANYNLAPKSEIGPFVDESFGTYTTLFPATKVNIGTVNIGVAIGVRLFQNKGQN